MPTRKKEKASKRRYLSHFLHSHPREKAVLEFLIKFNVFAIPLYTIIILRLQWEFLQSLTANLSYYLLEMMGVAAVKAGNSIIIPVANGSWSAFISWDCTGWKSMLLLSALVLATSFPLALKAKGLLLMIPGIFLFNIARTAFMIWFVGAFDLAYFDVVHEIVWSWGLLAAVLALWIAWMKICKRFS